MRISGCQPPGGRLIHACIGPQKRVANTLNITCGAPHHLPQWNRVPSRKKRDNYFHVAYSKSSEFHDAVSLRTRRFTVQRRKGVNEKWQWSPENLGNAVCCRQLSALFLHGHFMNFKTIFICIKRFITCNLNKCWLYFCTSEKWMRKHHHIILINGSKNILAKNSAANRLKPFSCWLIQRWERRENITNG